MIEYFVGGAVFIMGIYEVINSIYENRKFNELNQSLNQCKNKLEKVVKKN